MLFLNFSKENNVSNFDNIKSKLKKYIVAKTIINVNHHNVLLINDIESLKILKKHSNLDGKKITNSFMKANEERSVKATVDRVLFNYNLSKVLSNVEKIKFFHEIGVDFIKITGEKISFFKDEDTKNFYINHIYKMKSPDEMLLNIDELLKSDDLISFLMLNKQYKGLFTSEAEIKSIYNKAFEYSAYNICSSLLKEQCSLWDGELFESKKEYFLGQEQLYIKEQQNNGNMVYYYKKNAQMLALETENIQNQKYVLSNILTPEHLDLTNVKKKRL